MAELTERIEATVLAIAARQAAYLASWGDLFVALGRAQQATTTAEQRHWLYEAETLEYELCGDCEAIGPVLEAFDELGVDHG